jgi:hypothetical protein
LAALPLILGASHNDDADYLDTCRAKRNTAEYDAAGTISRSEAEELHQFTGELQESVISWLKSHHPRLIAARDS